MGVAVSKRKAPVGKGGMEQSSFQSFPETFSDASTWIKIAPFFIARKEGSCGLQKFPIDVLNSIGLLLFYLDPFNRLRPELPKVIDVWKNFEGSEELVRRFLTQPSPEDEEAAFLATQASSLILVSLYDFTYQLSEYWSELLQSIHQNLPPRRTESIVSTCTIMFKFILMADEHKRTTPAIQNDLSFFRRQIGKRGDLETTEKKMNQLALFYAHPACSMKAFLDVTEALTPERKTAVGKFFCDYINSLLPHIPSGSIPSPSLAVFLGTSIVIMDNMLENGVFNSKSILKTGECLKVILRFRSQDGLEISMVLNTLRFITKHYYDEDSKSSIRSLLQ